MQRRPTRTIGANSTMAGPPAVYLAKLPPSSPKHHPCRRTQKLRQSALTIQITPIASCFSFVFVLAVRLLPCFSNLASALIRAEEGASDAWTATRLDLISNAPIEPHHVTNTCGKRYPLCPGGQEDIYEISPTQPALAIPKSRRQL